MPDVRETEYASRLENLKSTLKSSYKLVWENNYKLHVTNKEYFDRKAKEKNFEDEIVYLFNPAKKPGQSSKFWSPWVGPCKAVACLLKLNYCIVNMQGKEFVMHSAEKGL